MVNIYILLEWIKLNKYFDLPILFTTTPSPHPHFRGWTQLAQEIILKQHTILKNHGKSPTPPFHTPNIRYKKILHTVYWSKMPSAESKKGETPTIECRKQLLDVGCEEKKGVEENINRMSNLDWQVKLVSYFVNSELAYILRNSLSLCCRPRMNMAHSMPIHLLLCKDFV